MTLGPRIVLLTALAAASPLSAPASRPAAAPPSPPSIRSDGDAKRLDRALSAVSETALRGDLAFLATDEMAGRDTPSDELWIAALFLRARLERLGFRTTEPDGGPRAFFHEYPLHARGLDTERSAVLLRSGERTDRLEFGRDYFLARPSHLAERDTAGLVVSVGRGSREEFEAARLEGRWALLFDRGVSLRRTLRYAEKAGAVGVLFVRSSEASDGGKPYAERFDVTTRLLREPQAAILPAVERSADDPAVVMLAPGGAARLFEMAPAEWSGLVPPPGLALSVQLEEIRRVDQREIAVPNVAGFWPGSDPELAREVVIVSAHFDHVGRSGDDVYNGADDNASGTAGLLAVAEALSAYGPMQRSVLLLWVSGEEKGLWGSKSWSLSPRLPEGCTAVADLNVDMIGRTEPDTLYVTPTTEHEAYNTLARAAYEQAPLEGFPELLSQDQDWARSDHYQFHELLQIPVVFLSAGEHPDYHKPTDTADKIDYAKLARVARLVVRMLASLGDEPIEYL